MPRIALHRLGRRRRLRRIRHRPSGFRAPICPTGYSDTELAPLLCAGIIGYRSLLRADLPAGGRLGIYGFGGSAHLTAQVALAQGAEVHVMTRGERARELALALGAASAQGADRSAAGATGRRDPVRARRRSGAARPRGARPRRHAGHRRHLPQRHSGAELRAAPVPGAPGAIGDIEHPRRRARVPRLRGPPSHRGDQPASIRSTAPTRRSPI